MADFKPMLAGKIENDNAIKFPVIASPKIDGVRAANKDGSLLSRSLKLIPNKHVQATLGFAAMHGLDGELTVGLATDKNVMQHTTSGVMSHDKLPAFTYNVFDYWDNDGGFEDRYRLASTLVKNLRSDWSTFAAKASTLGAGSVPVCPIQMVEHQIIWNLDQLNAYEVEMLEEGWEGVMIRSIDGRYKHGRSTMKEGGLLKVKRFEDGEAIIIGFEEEMQNNNEKVVNELGRSKRSSHKGGKSGKATLGAFVMRDLKTDIEFSCGTGLTDEFAAEVWANRTAYLNCVGKYKFFAHGVKDAPRHPVWLGFRDARDMS